MRMEHTMRALAAALAVGAPLPAQGRLLDFPNQLKPETAVGLYVAGDVDGDGDLDLVVAPSLFQSHLLLLANDGAGGFRSVDGAFPPAPVAVYYDGVLFDVEGDGRANPVDVTM